MSMILERQYVGEIFVENKQFVEVFPPHKVGARSGGRARLPPSVAASAAGASLLSLPSPGEKTLTLPDQPLGAVEFLRHVRLFGLFWAE